MGEERKPSIISARFSKSTSFDSQETWHPLCEGMGSSNRLDRQLPHKVGDSITTAKMAGRGLELPKWQPPANLMPKKIFFLLIFFICNADDILYNKRKEREKENEDNQDSNPSNCRQASKLLRLSCWFHLSSSTRWYGQTVRHAYEILRFSW